MKMNRRSVLALLLAAPACGYTLAGKGAGIDPTIKKLGVPLFKDDSSDKPGLDLKITQKVIEELLKRGKVDVVQERTGVDALVEGEITGYDASPIGFSEDDESGTTQASRFAISVRAKVRYMKVGAEEPIWQNDSFSFRDEYDLGGTSADYFDREDQALDRLALSFARSLVSAMLEAF
jgi:hypothetical protein